MIWVYLVGAVLILSLIAWLIYKLGTVGLIILTLSVVYLVSTQKTAKA